MPVTQTTPFGLRLQEWRQLRRLSQLSLASDAGTTPRHLSFLETGRSRPSRAMVARLAGALALPLRAENEMFVAAGFAAAFTESPLAATALAPFRAAIARILRQHEPYPAFVIDGRWNVVDTNGPAAGLFAAQQERNVVRLMYGGAWRPLIDNWDAMAVLGVRRLEDDLHRHPGDAELAALVELASDAVRGLPPYTNDDSGELVVCPHFRFGETVVRTVSVIAHFGSARDVTLDELRVELIFPADATADAFFREAYPMRELLDASVDLATTNEG